MAYGKSPRKGAPRTPKKKQMKPKSGSPSKRGSAAGGPGSKISGKVRKSGSTSASKKRGAGTGTNMSKKAPSASRQRRNQRRRS